MRFLLMPFLVMLVAAAFAQKPYAQPDEKSLSAGKEIYTINCQSCHMEQGEGLEGVYPPLAKSDYLMADKSRAVRQILNGVTGAINVNGVVYNAEMQGFSLSDQELVDLLNYIRNSFGNKGGTTTLEEVRSAKTKP